MASLKTEGLPEAVLAKLKPLVDVNHVKEAEYLTALEKALGKELLSQHKAALLRAATLPNNGGGADTLGQILLGHAVLPEDGKAIAESYAAVRRLLLEWQEPDATWEAAGQLPNLQWASKMEANEATTMWNILAITPEDEPLADADADVDADASRDKALRRVANAAPGLTVQSLALRLLLATKFGPAGTAEPLLKELLARQNADGGWSWTKAQTASEAFSTGQVLYALGLAGRRGGDPQVRKGWDFLVRTQQPDGSWDVPYKGIGKRDIKFNVYHLWGSAWAALGILQGLPDP